MACDEALGICADQPVLRFYQWDPPAVSLGYFQSFEEVEPFCAEIGCTETVKRITGGGAIYHFSELTYSLITRPDELNLPAKVRESYRFLHAPFVKVFHELGIISAEMNDCAVSERKPVCFNSVTSFDISVNGKKLMGSAQRRHKQFFLQHGSIPLAENTFSSEATSIEEELGHQISVEELISKLTAEISTQLEIAFDPSALTKEEHEEVKKIIYKYDHHDA